MGGLLEKGSFHRKGGGFLIEKWGFRGFAVKNRGCRGENGVLGDLWIKIEVLMENGGFFGKWGFRGFLVKNSGKIRKEPGI